MKETYRFFRSRFNPNLFRYKSALDRRKHALDMRREGKVTQWRWSGDGSDGVTWYFAEYKEIAKA